jgi:ferredoxin
MADPFVSLMAAAAVTTRLKLGTGICLVIEHDPIVLAKTVATLDMLCEGRFLLGIGGGWQMPCRSSIAWQPDPDDPLRQSEEICMANFNKRVPENVPGEFFVDSTCIDCDTCRQLAPAIFGETGAYAYVYAQPRTAAETRQALRALLACPTGSIGTLHRHNIAEMRADFPLHLDNGVFYCGFNSPRSYGGNSYVVQHGDGNWLIDSPKFLPHLVRQFENMGGLATHAPTPGADAPGVTRAGAAHAAAVG